MGKLKQVKRLDRSAVARSGARAARAPAGADVRQGARRPLPRRQRGVGGAVRRCSASAFSARRCAISIRRTRRSPRSTRPRTASCGSSRGAQSYDDPDRHARRPAARDDLLQGRPFRRAPSPQGLVGAIFDVTARTRAEIALRESEERFRAVVDSANEGMLVYDRTLNIIVSANRAAERILGLPAGRADRQARLHLAAAVHPRGRHAARPGRAPDAHHACAPGSRRPACVSASSAPTGGDLALGEHRVPAPRRRDRALRPGLDDHRHHRAARRRDAPARERGRFRDTFELAGSGMAHIGLDRRFIRVNRRLCEILGYPEEELLELHRPADLAPRRPRHHQRAAPARCYAGEIDAVRLEKRYLRKDGSVVWVKFTMTVERDAAGQAAVRDRGLRRHHRAARRRAARCARARSASARPSSSPPRASATWSTAASCASTAACARSSATPRRSCSAST